MDVCLSSLSVKVEKAFRRWKSEVSIGTLQLKVIGGVREEMEFRGGVGISKL